MQKLIFLLSGLFKLLGEGIILPGIALGFRFRLFPVQVCPHLDIDGVNILQVRFQLGSGFIPKLLGCSPGLLKVFP